jgi:hypothetical protein
MAIRLPLKVVLSSDNSTELGAGSVSGAVPLSVTLPQDTDNVVVKFQASTVGGGVSAVFQTTDDGGATWFDVARTSIISNGVGQTSEWLSVPVVSSGSRPNNVTSSVLSTIKKAGSLTVGANQYTGMPILSQSARVAIVITGDLTSAASNLITTEVKVNSQSATS